MVGLRALKELVRALQHEIDQKRKILIQIAEQAYPMLESIMNETIQNNGSPNQLKVMILVSKIFYMTNYMKMLPFLVQPGKLGVWVNFFTAILDSPQDDSSSLVQQTTSAAQIDQLDKQEWWKLKAICSKISVKLYQK